MKKWTIIWGCLSEGIWLEGIFDSRELAQAYLRDISKLGQMPEIIEISEV